MIRGFALRLLCLIVPLVLAACTKLPPQLTLPQLSLADSAFQPTLEAFTGAPIVGSNQVDILLNGEETFPAMLQAIRSAQRSVTFETYIFRESDIGNQLVEAMADRCRAGVSVSILLDAHGSGDVPDDYVQRLRDAGCAIVPDFRPLRFWTPRRSNFRTHRRIVVVDGEVGFTGGYGIDDTWAGDGQTKGHWRETNVRIEGPVVQELQAAFIEHWQEATGALLGGRTYFPYRPVAVSADRVQAQVVRSSPTKDNFTLYTLFLQAISAAERTIFIATPYLFPGEQMGDALIGAAGRGVKVVVLVPAIIRERWMEYMVQESQREGFDELLDGGIELHEYDPALLHTKMMVIDGRWATVGSTNLDNRSMGMNDELNLVIYDEPVARRLEGIFFQDLTRSRLITKEGLTSRHWLGRLLAVLTGPLTNQF